MATCRAKMLSICRHCVKPVRTIETQFRQYHVTKVGGSSYRRPPDHKSGGGLEPLGPIGVYAYAGIDVCASGMTVYRSSISRPLLWQTSGVVMSLVISPNSTSIWTSSSSDIWLWASCIFHDTALHTRQNHSTQSTPLHINQSKLVIARPVIRL